jgi:Glycosyl hydrolases family 32 N-terminal domain/PAN domain
MILPASRPAALLALAALASTAAATPLACQPNEQQPMMPSFHIIGNVTQAPDGNITLEPINDASGVTYSENGIYHVWHQCCQNHWDHIISRDLIHWQRLPPPIQPVTLKTWDGSISMVDASFGGPVILYDAQDGKVGSHGQDPRTPADKAILGVARLADPNDKYLMTWTRAENNPVEFTGAPIAFPGQVWRNGDHFNFVGQGSLFQTKDATFHTATNVGEFTGRTEHSGNWWMPTPNMINGSAPPNGAPNRAVNVNGGADYLLGTYDPATESFTSANVTAHLEGGRADWFGGQGGSDNNNRMMIVGWAMPDYNGPAGPGITFLTRLTLVREVNYDAALGSLVANPLPELVNLRSGTLASETGVALGAAPHLVPGTGGGAAASADINITFSGFAPGDSFGACVLSNGNGSGLGVLITAGGGASNYYMPNTDLPGGDYNVTNVQYDDPHLCQAACTADGEKCKAFTYVVRPPLKGSCCLKSSAPAPAASPTCTSGIKAPAPPGSVSVRVGTCAEAASGALALGAARSVPLLDDSTVSLRVLPDRSVADVFVQGGRWAGTVAWLDKAPRAPADSTVTVWSSKIGVSADIDVYSMGCGWVDPSYTDTPTL